MDTAERGVLFESAVDDVSLPQAPLTRVIGQLRFGTLSVLASGDEAAQAFMKALAEDYPFVEQGLEQALLFAPGQPVQQAELGKVWRLRSVDLQSVVALTSGSLTFETASYQGRTSFCEELVRLADVLRNITRIATYNRVAMRYTNRLAGADTLSQLTKLIHPELLGLVGARLRSGVDLAYTLSQALLSFGETSNLLVQFGRLPKDGTFDPTIQALDEPSWVLDLDSYEEFPNPRQALTAQADAVSAALEKCAERAYVFFRWAVTNEFLTYYGGRP